MRIISEVFLKPMSGLSPIKLNKEMAAFLSHSSARMNSCCWVNKMERQTTKTGRVAVRQIFGNGWPRSCRCEDRLPASILPGGRAEACRSAPLSAPRFFSAPLAANDLPPDRSSLLSYSTCRSIQSTSSTIGLMEGWSALSISTSSSRRWDGRSICHTLRLGFQE